MNRAEAKILQRLLRKAADTIEALSKKLSTNGDWIPCSERLPKKSGEYIVMISGAELPTCLNFLSSDNSWFDMEKDYEVSYWQPLPEAYHG